jgi:hypothetical protein
VQTKQRFEAKGEMSRGNRLRTSRPRRRPRTIGRPASPRCTSSARCSSHSLASYAPGNAIPTLTDGPEYSSACSNAQQLFNPPFLPLAPEAGQAPIRRATTIIRTPEVWVSDEAAYSLLARIKCFILAQKPEWTGEQRRFNAERLVRNLFTLSR